jgi:MFS family permease
LYLARAFSLFGDALVPVALAFAVLAVDRSPTALGFVLASRFVSLVVFLLVGGVIGDRLSRKGVLIASDIVRFGAQSITAWLLITAHAMVWELVALAFVYGMGEAFFRPTSTGFVPETVSRARLQQANALLAVTTNTWTVVGPVVAGVLVTTVGAGWAIGADALTFLVSALFVWRIRSSRPLPRPESTFFRDLADGWQVFTSQTWLWVDGVFSAISNCVVLAPLLALGPVVALRSLGGAPSWATIVAALGIGSTLGGLALLRVTPSRPLLLGVPLLALLALPTALLAVPAPTVVIAVGALAGGFGLAVFNTLFETTVQHHVAPDALSRVSSIDWLMSVGLFPLGLAVAGPAAAAFGVRLPLVIAAAWIVASTIIVLAVPSVRHIRLVRSTEPSGRVDEAEPRESLSNPASLE